MHRLFAILYKGLKHLCILVFMGILESVPCILVPGTTVCRMYAFPEYFIDSESGCYDIESISPLCVLFTSITGMSQFFFSKYCRTNVVSPLMRPRAKQRWHSGALPVSNRTAVRSHA